MLDGSSLALHVPTSLTDTFRALDLCGVLLNGILGGLIARRKSAIHLITNTLLPKMCIDSLRSLT